MSKVKSTRWLIAIAGVLLFTGAGLAWPQSPQSPRPTGEPTDQKTSRPQTQTETDRRADQNRSTLDSADQRFIREATETGTAEVAFGELAAQKASNAEVKQFAQRMVDDHTKANQELTQLASQKGVSLPQIKEGSSSPGAASTTSAAVPTNPQRTPEIPKDQQPGIAAQGANEAQLQGKHKDSLDRLSRLSGADFDREYMKLQLKGHEKAVNLFQKQADKGKDAELKAWAAKTLPTLQEHQQNARQVASAVGVADKAAGASSSKKEATSSGRP